MKKVKLDSLMIEVTRRCNMRCAHCLCGDAQEVDINHQDIRNILRHVSHVRSINFSGGEPSLNVKAIKYTLNLIKQKNIHVEEFCIYTNGSKSSISKQFIDVCCKLYEYQTKDALPGYHDYILIMSNDPYHDKKYQEEVHAILSKLPFYRRSLEYGQQIHLLKQGRSKEGAELGIDKIGLFRGEVFGGVLLSATGYVLAETNFSYENQKKHKLCHSSGFMKYLKSVEIKSLYP